MTVAATKNDLLDDHVSLSQCRKAIDALHSHISKTLDKRAETELLPPQDQHVWLTVTVRKISTTASFKVTKIPIKHPLVDPRTTQICLITKDPQREYKDLLEKQNVKFISRVVGIQKLKGKFKPFEARRHLLKEHGLFLADDRVIPLLPRLLGSKWFEAKKQPFPVCLTRNDVKSELERAISSTYMHQNHGTCTSIKIGVWPSQTPDQVLANLVMAIPKIVQNIKDGWENIQILHIKTSNSVALPIWSCGMGSEPGERWHGLLAKESKTEGVSNEEDDDEEESDDDDEEVQPQKKKLKVENGSKAGAATKEKKKKASSTKSTNIEESVSSLPSAEDSSRVPTSSKKKKSFSPSTSSHGSGSSLSLKDPSKKSAPSASEENKKKRKQPEPETTPPSQTKKSKKSAAAVVSPEVLEKPSKPSKSKEQSKEKAKERVHKDKPSEDNATTKPNKPVSRNEEATAAPTKTQDKEKHVSFSKSLSTSSDGPPASPNKSVTPKSILKPSGSSSLSSSSASKKVILNTLERKKEKIRNASGRDKKSSGKAEVLGKRKVKI